jgi:hypothetical protein
MNTPFDPHASAVEKMLHDRTRQTPPLALRSRVLASIDAVLPKKVPATKFGQAAQPHSPEYADLVAGTFLMAAVLSLLIVALLLGEAASSRLAAVPEPPRLSFTQRAEAAGITLDPEPPSTGHIAVSRPHDTAVPRRGNILSSLDTRFFLQGDL